jgi:hypothetical protein
VKKKKKKETVTFDNSIPTNPNPGVSTDETLFYDAISDHPSEYVVPSSTGPDPSQDPSPVPSPDENSGVDSDGNHESSST